MASAGLAAFGTLFKMGDGATSEAFTTIAEVTNISGPKLALDMIEITNHSSPSAWREYVASFLDMGEITLELNFIPTNATHQLSASGLAYHMVNRTKKNFQLVFPDTGSTTWSFSGYVSGFEINAPVDDKLGGSVTIRPTGGMTQG